MSHYPNIVYDAICEALKIDSIDEETWSKIDTAITRYNESFVLNYDKLKLIAKKGHDKEVADCIIKLKATGLFKVVNVYIDNESNPI